MRSRGRGGGFTVRLDTTCTGGGDSIVDLGGTLIASGGLFFGDGTDNILGVVYILEDAQVRACIVVVAALPSFCYNMKGWLESSFGRLSPWNAQGNYRTQWQASTGSDSQTLVLGLGRRKRSTIRMDLA